MSGAIDSFLQSVENQAWSTGIRESIWVYPIIESVHVLTIAVFVGFAIMLDLRLLGVFMTRQPVSRVSAAFLPRTHVAFVVMLISGALLFYAKPIYTAYNPFFQAKAVFFLVALGNIYWFHRIVSGDISGWDANAVPPLRARMAGVISIVCWVSVVACGRLIAYNWF